MGSSSRQGGEQGICLGLGFCPAGIGQHLFHCLLSVTEFDFNTAVFIPFDFSDIEQVQLGEFFRREVVCGENQLCSIVATAECQPFKSCQNLWNGTAEERDFSTL